MATEHVNDLVERFLPYARWLIRKYIAGRHPLDPAELESAVMFALFESAGRFDPRRGCTFKTFFTHRAHGAVRDACRGEDLLSRTDRGRLNTDTPRPDGSVVVEPSTMSLDMLHAGEEGHPEKTLSPHALFGSTDSNLDALLGQELDLDELMGRLPERERLVVYLYFYEDLTLAAIAQFVGDVSESRVSQLMTRALERLRFDVAGVRRPVRHRAA